jgi:hypothetical protein
MTYYNIGERLVPEHCFHGLYISDNDFIKVSRKGSHTQGWWVMADYMVGNDLFSEIVGNHIPESTLSAKSQLGLILRNITINVD